MNRSSQLLSRYFNYSAQFYKKSIRIPDKLFSTQPEIGAIQFSEIDSYGGVMIP